MKRTLLSLLVLLITLSSTYLVLSAPEGVNIGFNSSETKGVTPATGITTAGGSFTTLLLNGTYQNPRWKAFVGNISGALTLDDGGDSTIYDWDMAVVTGEVYASRSDSVDWGVIDCIDDVVLSSEESAINFDTSKDDSINSTFNNTVHQQFLVAGRTISNSSCRSIATFTSNSRQALSESADFQQILLGDGGVAVYATILENGATGYDGSSTFDFQMIVPDDETAGVDTTYYFYAELG